MKHEAVIASAVADEVFVGLLGPMLRSISCRMREHVIGSADSVGLAVPLAMALQGLDPDHPRPMNDLAGALRCDPSHVTGIADRLENQGLVTRQPAAYDRRVKELQVTAAGRQRRAEFIARLTEVPLAIEALDEAERASLLAMLERVLAVTPRPAGNGTGWCPTDELRDSASGDAGDDCPAGDAGPARLPVPAGREPRDQG